MVSRIRSYLLFRLASIVVLFGLLAIYAPTVKFGLIWDDPEWFSRVVDAPFPELLVPSADYQFYRPGGFLYNRLFVQTDHTLEIAALHWLQICWHLLNAAALSAIVRHMGVGRWQSLTVVALAGMSPIVFQAVAWAAPQQPLASALQSGAWISYLIGRQHGASSSTPNGQKGLGRKARQWLAIGASLLLFLFALTVQESTVSLSLVPVLLEWARWAMRQRGSPSPILTNPKSFLRSTRFALLFPLVAILFSAIWLQAPRRSGITSLNFEVPVLAFLLQGLIYPLLGRPGGYAQATATTPILLVLLATATLGLLLLQSIRRGRGNLAATGLGWAALGVLPALLGLSFSYVSLASRLLYFVAPGAAMLWTCALWPESSAGSRWRLRRSIGPLLLAVIVLQSVWLLLADRSRYRAGTSHITELLEAIGEEDGRHLFINYPDRYRPKRPPYPLGYWGVTLAPVAVDLADFARVQTGSNPQTMSISQPWLDTQERDQGPYQVDMRGVITAPDELYRIAGSQDAIYLSRYLADGRFLLQKAGRLQPAAGTSCTLARYADLACLDALELDAQADSLEVQLSWSAISSLPEHVTIFAHVGLPGRPPLAQADGDSWRGALPPHLWQPGDLIVEWRSIPLPETYRSLSIAVGLYDWVSGVRLPATDPGGRSLAHNAFSLPLGP